MNNKNRLRMKVQGVELTEYEILRRFSIMEKHFPRCIGKNYFPSLNFYLKYEDNKSEAIKEEADKMLAFVGLGTYTSRIKFGVLIGAAGNINLTTDMYADVTIDEDISTDKDRVMSTLAHEICHKVLSKRGIWFNGVMEDENEIYADLATFYVGFGDLTMRGYHTEHGRVTHDLGYLTPKTYARAYIVMTMINNNVEYEFQSLPLNAQIEIKEAEKESHLYYFKNVTKENLSSLFVEASAELASIQLYLQELSALINENQKKIQEIDKNISSSFYPDMQSSKELIWHKMTMAFTYLQYSKQGNNVGDYSKYRNTLDTLIGILEQLYSVSIPEQIKMESLRIIPQCPICGQKINKPLEEKTYHFICPRCRYHFYLDNRKKNVIERMNEYRKIRLAIRKQLAEIPGLKEKIDSFHKDINTLTTENKRIKSDKNKWYKKIFRKYRK